MSALLQSYLDGLSRLKGEVKAKGGDNRRLDLLEARLNENIDRTTEYGFTLETQRERNEILDSLNKFTRDLYDISFIEYCRSSSHQSTSDISTVQKGDTSTGDTVTKGDEQFITSSDPLTVVQQTKAFLLSANEYVIALQENVQQAREIFNNGANIGQEQCEKALSPFCTFDCSNFPDHNQSLYKAKIRLQYLNEQVNKLIDLCEICDDIDRPLNSSKRKIQDLVGILDTLTYDVVSVQGLLSIVDVEISTQ